MSTLWVGVLIVIASLAAGCPKLTQHGFFNGKHYEKPRLVKR
jgi:hypothetical protein